MKNTPLVALLCLLSLEAQAANCPDLFANIMKVLGDDISPVKLPTRAEHISAQADSLSTASTALSDGVAKRYTELSKKPQSSEVDEELGPLRTKLGEKYRFLGENWLRLAVQSKALALDSSAHYFLLARNTLRSFLDMSPSVLRASEEEGPAAARSMLDDRRKRLDEEIADLKETPDEQKLEALIKKLDHDDFGYFPAPLKLDSSGSDFAAIPANDSAAVLKKIDELYNSAIRDIDTETLKNIQELMDSGELGKMEKSQELAEAFAERAQKNSHYLYNAATEHPSVDSTRIFAASMQTENLAERFFNASQRVAKEIREKSEQTLLSFAGNFDKEAAYVEQTMSFKSAYSEQVFSQGNELEEQGRFSQAIQNLKAFQSELQSFGAEVSKLDGASSSLRLVHAQNEVETKVRALNSRLTVQISKLSKKEETRLQEAPKSFPDLGINSTLPKKPQ